MGITLGTKKAIGIRVPGGFSVPVSNTNYLTLGAVKAAV
jgi:hypothetical protein